MQTSGHGPVAIDYILNGRGHGSLAEHIASRPQFDPLMHRPFFDEDGRVCVLVNTGKTETRKDDKGQVIVNGLGLPVRFPVHDILTAEELLRNGIVVNATMALPIDSWKAIDRSVTEAYQAPLRAWDDLRNSSRVGGFDAWSHSIYEYSTIGDALEAFVDMDGMTEGRNDRPLIERQGLPLPIIHADWWFSARPLDISRAAGMPLDTANARFAARRVGERIEAMTIGTEVGMQFGDSSDYPNLSKIYGYTNFPDRVTKSDLTRPTAGGWTPATLTNELLECLDLLRADGFNGPFIVYTSTDWNLYLDQDYSANYGGTTLRNRLLQIEGVRAIRQLNTLLAADYPFTFIIIQMTSDVAQAIDGMEIQTIQWPSLGGQRLNFKTMAIKVPLLKRDIDGRCGILHANAA